MWIEGLSHADPRLDPRRCGDFSRLPPGLDYARFARTLNGGLLPVGYYALSEQIAGGWDRTS